MATPGRRPIPTRLKIINGNPGGAKRIRKDEPKPKATKPLRAPAHLSAEARKEYRSAAKLLAEIGVLTDVDHRALELYAESYAVWKDAMGKVNASGAVIKLPSGYPSQNPYLSIANTASKRMQSLLTEFGMTPSSRTRISAPPPDEDEFSRF